MSSAAMGDMNRAVERVAREAGASLVGFADVEGLAALPRAVVIAMAMSPETLADPDDMPNLAYAREYEELNRRLTAVAQDIGQFLAEAGYATVVNGATVGSIDVTTLSAPFAHKTAATRAGLGWIGKSALLVTLELGPAVRLGSVLTDAPLSVGTPITESRCGECMVCREACPGNAITGELWHAGRPREEFYDAFACFKTARARAKAIGVEHSICGVCVAVCPRRPR